MRNYRGLPSLGGADSGHLESNDRSSAAGAGARRILPIGIDMVGPGEPRPAKQNYRPVYLFAGEIVGGEEGGGAIESYCVAPLDRCRSAELGVDQNVIST